MSHPPHMPPEAPLPMRPQSFRHAPDMRGTLPRWRRGAILWRLGAFGPPLVLTIAFLAGLVRWFASGGFTGGEALAVILIGATFIWVSLTVSAVAMAILQLVLGRRAGRAEARTDGQSVALLVPVFNENPADVWGNIAAMRAELSRAPGADRFAFFILSDSQDARIAAEEARAFAHLDPEGAIPVYYRRRAANTDKKTGNLNDWISRWGADWEAMIVLDADSLMSGAAIRQLSDALKRDPDAGLIQSFPVLISSETLFGRMQEFATSVYGWLLAEGLALWSQAEGNYWGHNAIIRTRAFAESARLPYLRGLRGREDLILSHDFVEAGMLRRAGWAVRFLPHPGGSFEETPATLIDYILRDRRWCRGNLQHLRLLAARGFHPISRFHLLQGAMAYLLSPAWFALLVVWSAFLPMTSGEPGAYFTPANPLYPVWPQVSQINGAWFLVLVYSMLLLPKVLAAALTARSGTLRRLYGGGARFAATTATEIFLAVLYAPILMVQQSVAVFTSLIGRPLAWVPQRRGQVSYGWPTLLRFHWLEVVLGLALIGGVVMGQLSSWLLPVTISLVFAPVLSKLSGLKVADARLRTMRLDSPLSLRAPRVAVSARAERARIAAILKAEDTPAIAAE